MKILIVEDDLEFREQIVRAMSPFDEIHQASSISESRRLIDQKCFDVAILDKKLPDGEALPLISKLKESNLNCAILILTGDGHLTHEKIYPYMAAGAHDYIQKSEYNFSDFKIRIPAVLGKIALLRKSQVFEDWIQQSFRYEMLGSSEKTQQLRARISALKGNSASILITGESGTGKELVARMLNIIETPARNFVIVHCGAIVENLVESELFGHKKGAFTGAFTEKIGKFELAHHGDIFLDEIGDLPLPAQIKLLRFLQECEFYRVGDSVIRHSSARVIAATHKNLLEEVNEGRFRKDLYYRLNVIPIQVTPLRERREDIPDIANFLLGIFEKGRFSFGTGVLDLLLEQAWEGNVRELRNAIERGTFEAKIRKSSVIEKRDLFFLPKMNRSTQSFYLSKDTKNPTSPTQKVALFSNEENSEKTNSLLPQSLNELSQTHLENYLQHFERLYFQKALSLFNDQVEPLAQHMGLSRSGLFRRLKFLQLTDKRLKRVTRLNQEIEKKRKKMNVISNNSFS